MTDNTANNKRIAKNTLVLYVRMLFMMAVSLYTSRVVLAALGVDDFGIYNVVGGVVAMFSMISGSLSSAISRFLTFELGKGDKDKLATVFSSSVTIQIAIFAIILVCAETIGVWFLNNKMVIPESRMVAANWVFQFSVILFGVNLISVPYNAAITAHERMTAFAYISIVDALGKLGIAYAVSVSPIDRLIMYGALLLILGCIMRLIYGVYCNRHFEECHYRYVWDKELLKQMFSFAGWNFIGSSSALMRDAGVNIVLNLFCGPAVNAARGVAQQINHAVHNFSSNFMTAINPQITKSYANGDHEYMMKLIFRSSRYSFLLLMLLSLPIILNTEFILNLWLKEVPEHAVLFCQLILIFGMTESLSSPLITAMLATGKIRNYQIIVGGLQMMNLPISYLFLYLGFFPESVVVVAIAVGLCCLASRLYMLRNMIGLKSLQFITNVCLRVLSVFVISAIVPIYIVTQMEYGLLRFFITSVACIFCSIVAIMFVGCDKSERDMVVSFIKKKFCK